MNLVVEGAVAKVVIIIGLVVVVTAWVSDMIAGRSREIGLAEILLITASAATYLAMPSLAIVFGWGAVSSALGSWIFARIDRGLVDVVQWLLSVLMTLPILLMRGTIDIWWIACAVFASLFCFHLSRPRAESPESLPVHTESQSPRSHHL